MAKFQPGESGNPRGRTPRPRTGPDRLRANLLRDAPEILKALVEQAKGGDATAAKLVLDRCLPSLRPVAAPVAVPLGDDLTQATGAVLAALSAGSIGTDQAHDLASVLASLVKVREAVELENRIAALEAKR